jgi:hypothetical protein
MLWLDLNTMKSRKLQSCDLWYVGRSMKCYNFRRKDLWKERKNLPIPGTSWLQNLREWFDYNKTSQLFRTVSETPISHYQSGCKIFQPSIEEDLKKGKRIKTWKIIKNAALKWTPLKISLQIHHCFHELMTFL